MTPCVLFQGIEFNACPGHFFFKAFNLSGEVIFVGVTTPEAVLHMLRCLGCEPVSPNSATYSNFLALYPHAK